MEDDSLWKVAARLNSYVNLVLTDELNDLRDRAREEPKPHFGEQTAVLLNGGWQDVEVDRVLGRNRY